MPPKPLPTPVFSNEIRLGLVLYGGVSLAIYMNGVCREFYDAVRGRGVYKLIKALTDSDVVIDILSGTSAGGVNGILLGYAIANSDENAVVDFRQFADLWITNGSAEKLFGEPWLKGSGSEREHSLFDGSYYRSQLEQAFTEATTRPREPEWVSTFQELDLFVTATDLDGSIHRVPDNAGSEIDIKNHRTVFHLAHRRDQGDYLDNPFQPGRVTSRALAKLAQITSGFPVAFPVVEVALHPKQGNAVDERLVRWGRLWDRLSDDEHRQRTLSFVDGGVLSNRPFSTTIDTIYTRTAYRPTRRKLFYVDPNPEEFNATGAAERRASAPLRVAYDAKLEIPNYQSISSDLERIRQGNRQVVRHQLLRCSLTSLTQAEIENLRACLAQNPAGTTAYRQCRVLHLVDEAMTELLANSEEHTGSHAGMLEAATAMLSREALAEALPEAELEQFAQESAPWDIAFSIRKHCFLVGEISRRIQDLQKQPEGPRSVRSYLALRYLNYHLSWQLELLHILAKARGQLLRHFTLEDILDTGLGGKENQAALHRFLKAFHEVVFGPGAQGLTARDDGRLPAWEELLGRYYELVKVVAYPEIDFEQHPIDWCDLKMVLPEQESGISQRIFAEIYRLPVCAILQKGSLQEKLGIASEVKLRVKHRLQETPPSPPSGETILQVVNRHSAELVRAARGPIGNDELHATLQSLCENFEAIDGLLFPYEYLSDVATRNRIDLVRVSPNDADRHGYGSGWKLKDKLKGYHFNAFGGFFQEAWRTNDLLWGRLDGLDRLVNGLLNEQTMGGFQHFFLRNLETRVGEGRDRASGVIRAIDDLIAECLPAASPTEQVLIRDYLQAIHNEPPSRSVHGREAQEEFLDAVIRAGQRQILLEEDADGTLARDLDCSASSTGPRERAAIGTLRRRIRELRRELQRESPSPERFLEFDEAFRTYQEMKNTSEAYTHASGLDPLRLVRKHRRAARWTVGWLAEQIRRRGTRPRAPWKPGRIVRWLAVLVLLALPGWGQWGQERSRRG